MEITFSSRISFEENDKKNELADTSEWDMFTEWAFYSFVFFFIVSWRWTFIKY